MATADTIPAFNFVQQVPDDAEEVGVWLIGLTSVSIGVCTPSTWDRSPGIKATTTSTPGDSEQDVDEGLGLFVGYYAGGAVKLSRLLSLAIAPIALVASDAGIGVMTVKTTGLQCPNVMVMSPCIGVGPLN